MSPLEAWNMIISKLSGQEAEFPTYPKNNRRQYGLLQRQMEKKFI